jgi:hypothetical protein
MAHVDKGHYAAKHAGARPDERIAAAVRPQAGGGKLACADAERLAAELAAPLSEIGRTADLLEIRISGCQLGLFGHTPEQKSVRPADEVPAELEKAICGRLAEGGLPCADAWDIAAAQKIPRLKVSSACEALAIKIKPCQLGAF